MAHEITERDGLFTVREPAWHGLGTVLPDHPTREEAQKLAHPWEPVSEPVYRKVIRVEEVPHRHDRGLCTPDGTGGCMQYEDDPRFTDELPTESFEPVEDAVLNARSDDGYPLGVVSKTFTTVSNATLYEIAEAIEGEEQGSVLYETGGSLKGGRKVWLLMRLAEPVVIAGDPNGAVIPYYALQNAHDGSGSFRGQATMTRIVCHAKGTPMLHDGEWIPVEEHPTYRGSKVEAGLRVHVAGLPFGEVVTLDHKYLTEHRAAHFTEAQDLVKWPQPTEIAHPIDMSTVERVELEALLGDLIDDKDFWWAVGLWWGDGHLHHTRQVTWTVADTEPEIGERLMGFLERQGFKGDGSKRDGCWQVTWSSPTLRAFLETFYVGEGHGKGGRAKVPPALIEHLPSAATRQIVDGYWDADGSSDARGGHQWTSTSLDGLLVLRRLLLRLGRVSSIRQARRETFVTNVAGHQATVRPNYTLRESPNPQGLRIDDGVLYSKVTLVEWAGQQEFVPITTEGHVYMTAFGQSHNCDNTAQMADLDARARGTEFVFSHTKNVADRIIEAKAALAGWRLSVEAFQDQANYLAQLGITTAQRELFLERFIPMPMTATVSDRVVSNVEEARGLVRIFLDSATCEGIAGTAYGLMQASVEYLNHGRRAHSQESRFKRSYLDRNAVVAHAVALIEQVALHG